MIKTNRFLVVLTFLTMSVAVPALAQPTQSAKQVPTVDGLLKVETISGARISPDGRWVVYTVSSTDFDHDAFVTQLWVTETATGKRTQLTRGPRSAGNARWSPDSQWLAFTSNRQISMVRPTGGEAMVLTNSPTGVREFEWSPDGKMIAYLAEAPSQARKERDARYGQYEVVQQEHNYLHIWTISVADARNGAVASVQRTQGKDFSVDMLSWSPDSARIAFSARIYDGPGYAKQNTSDIYLLSVSDNAVKKIVSRDGMDANPHWSPDGASIVFTSTMGNTGTAVDSRLAVMKVDGSEQPRSITDKFDEDPTFVAWTKDGIYFSALQKTASHLFRVSPAGGAITRVTSPDSLMAGSFSIAADGRSMAFTADSPTSLEEVFVSSVPKFSPHALTRSTDQVKDFVLGSREVVSWKSRDGATIEGVLIKPPNFDPTKKYPLLVMIHGGPTGIDRPGLLASDTRYYPTDIFAARGALILKPNYRGGIGYGEAFRRLNLRNMGVGDAWDVLSGVDYLISRGFVDPKKVGCMGWSQGGYISAFLTASSDRFVAISDGAGVTDWVNYYYWSDDVDFSVDYLGGTPVTDPEIYKKTSPITYVKKGLTKTPTLIQHGEVDMRDPVTDAFELRRALEDIGVKVVYVEFKGLPHGLGKPKAHRLAMEQNLLWFNHYIWGDPEPDFTNMPQPQPTTSVEDRQ